MTLLAGYSLLPHSFIFILPSDFFRLDLKITISVYFFQIFLTLSEILFAFSQSKGSLKSILASLFSFKIDFLRYNMMVSTAKWWTLQKLRCLVKVMSNKDKGGPRTGSYDTPQFMIARLASEPYLSGPIVRDSHHS